MTLAPARNFLAEAPMLCDRAGCSQAFLRATFISIARKRISPGFDTRRTVRIRTEAIRFSSTSIAGAWLPGHSVTICRKSSSLIGPRRPPGIHSWNELRLVKNAVILGLTPSCQPS